MLHEFVTHKNVVTCITIIRLNDGNQVLLAMNEEDAMHIENCISEKRERDTSAFDSHRMRSSSGYN